MKTNEQNRAKYREFNWRKFVANRNWINFQNRDVENIVKWEIYLKNEGKMIFFLFSLVNLMVLRYEEGVCNLFWKVWKVSVQFKTWGEVNAIFSVINLTLSQLLFHSKTISLDVFHVMLPEITSVSIGNKLSPIEFPLICRVLFIYQLFFFLTYYTMVKPLEELVNE